MKNIFNLFIIAFLFLINCNAQDKTINSSVIKTEVNTIINSWHKAAAEANFEHYFNAMDNTSIFIGTDASEVWTKAAFKKFSKPFFDKGKAWSFIPLKRNIYVHSSKNIIWFDETLNTWMGICRGSGVLEKINNQWKIKHYVLSVTVPNEDIKPIIKIKQKRDSLFLNTLSK